MVNVFVIGMLGRRLRRWLRRRSEGLDNPVSADAEEEEMAESEEVVESLRWEPVSAAWRRG